MDCLAFRTVGQTVLLPLGAEMGQLGTRTITRGASLAVGEGHESGRGGGGVGGGNTLGTGRKRSMDPWQPSRNYRLSYKRWFQYRIPAWLFVTQIYLLFLARASKPRGPAHPPLACQCCHALALMNCGALA